MRCTLVLSTVGLLAALIGNAQTVSEPQSVDVFYRLDADRLLPLERQVAVIRGKAGGFIAVKTKGTLEFSGGKSPVRFRSNAQLEFVVRPPAADDPITLYCLRRLDSKKRIREIVIVSGHATPLGASTTVNRSKGVLPLKVSRYGAHSYKMTANRLAPGEYALSRVRGRLAFCFGVD